MLIYNNRTILNTRLAATQMMLFHPEVRKSIIDHPTACINIVCAKVVSMYQIH